MDEPDGEEFISPAKKSETILREVPTSPPPENKLDLSIIEKKCFHCKEPLPLHVYCIENITANAFADVECSVICKSCNDESTHLLSVKSDPVKKFVRSFVTPNSNVCLETINCRECKKPCNMDILNISALELNDEKVYVLFKCNLCKCEGQIPLPYKRESVQKFLLKLCN